MTHEAKIVGVYRYVNPKPVNRLLLRSKLLIA